MTKTKLGSFFRYCRCYDILDFFVDFEEFVESHPAERIPEDTGRFRGLRSRRHISVCRSVEDNMSLKKKTTRSDGVHRVRTTLASSIEEKLRRDLISAAFMPGEKLAIGLLQERYGTGASPVREALNRLSAEGWVLLADQRGFRVPPVSVDQLEELTRTRCLLNEVTLREAIARADGQSDEAIVVALHRLSRTSSRAPDNPKQINPEWEARHRAFHASLVAASGSRWLIEFDAMLFEQAARYRALSARSKIGRDVQKEHQAIADAVMARNVVEAVRLANAHITHTSTLVSQVTRRHETT
jgi:GntR family transcriptional regulator, carbon starvation induced regulator